MKNRFLITVIALIISCVKVSGQIARVLDKSNLQPVSDVLIYNNDKTLTATTNQKGEFDLSVFKENGMLIFQHISFQPYQITKSELISNGLIVYLVDDVIRLDEVVLSANKIEEKKSDLPHKIDVIPAKQIAFSNAQTTADMLQQSGSVFVQQSQLGGGSPVLRGFESNKVLIVVDAIRMNNAIYRGGHLQNVISLDPNMLEKTEIVYGPGSVIYGSGAIGGVMHFYSKSPVFSGNGETYVKTNIMARYSTANKESSGNVNFNIGFKKLAFLTSISYKNLDDLRTGNIRNPAYGDWGKCFFYADRINNMDTMIENRNVNIQKNSGYHQYDFLQKVLFRPNEKSRYVFNFQYSNTGDVPRYDRLAQFNTKTNMLKYAEWYYGPQSRLLASVKADYDLKTAFFDKALINIAYQNISEDRIKRKFMDNMKEFQEETVDVFSVNLALFKEATAHNEIRYGFDVNLNQVASNAYAKNIQNEEILKNIASRYPDNGSEMNALAAYVTHSWEIGKKVIFSQGIRFSSINLKAEYSDTMMKIMDFPFERMIKQTSNAINGSIGLVYMPGSDWRFSLMGSSGFRAPNVDDLGKVNDSKGTDQLLIVPNPNLKPEYAYNTDLTISKTIDKKIHLEATGFYTLLKDAIVTRPTTFNGQDSIIFDGVLSQVQANTNAGEAYVYGFQANLLAQVTKSFSIISNLTYTFGRVKENEEEIPLDHISPVYGRTTFRVEIKKFRGDFYVRYNGWKKLRDYSPGGEDNLLSATPFGTPAWYTLNVRAGYQLTQNLNIQFGLENILDDHYRVFSSGISAPGRNFSMTLRGSL